MIRPTSLLAGFALAISLVATAGAQTIGLGTTQGGATGQIATAIAQVVTRHGGGLQVRPQPVANTAQYIPPINAGQLEFGIANAPQTMNAFTGTGMSPGQPGPNLRMVGSLFPFNAGLVVTQASGMRAPADLRGRRVPWFAENSLGDVIMRGALEAAGLTPNDVTRVPMPNFPRMFDAFKAGQIDASIVAVGSQNTIEFQQSIAGGIRFLSFRQQDEAALARFLPGVRLRTMPVAATNPGIEQGTLVFSYAYTLFTHAGMAEDVVHRVAKAMSDHAAELRATSPLWEEYDPRDLSRDIGVPFHPGALRFFREAGLTVRP
jgi:hypothetical protein